MLRLLLAALLPAVCSAYVPLAPPLGLAPAWTPRLWPCSGRARDGGAGGPAAAVFPGGGAESGWRLGGGDEAHRGDHGRLVRPRPLRHARAHPPGWLLHFVAAVRDTKKMDALAKEMGLSRSDYVAMKLELASLRSVKDFVRNLKLFLPARQYDRALVLCTR